MKVLIDPNIAGHSFQELICSARQPTLRILAVVAFTRNRQIGDGACGLGCNVTYQTLRLRHAGRNPAWKEL